MRARSLRARLRGRARRRARRRTRRGRASVSVEVARDGVRQRGGRPQRRHEPESGQPVSLQEVERGRRAAALHGDDVEDPVAVEVSDRDASGRKRRSEDEACRVACDAHLAVRAEEEIPSVRAGRNPPAPRTTAPGGPTPAAIRKAGGDVCAAARPSERPRTEARRTAARKAPRRRDADISLWKCLRAEAANAETGSRENAEGRYGELPTSASPWRRRRRRAQARAAHRVSSSGVAGFPEGPVGQAVAIDVRDRDAGGGRKMVSRVRGRAGWRPGCGRSEARGARRPGYSRRLRSPAARRRRSPRPPRCGRTNGRASQPRDASKPGRSLRNTWCASPGPRCRNRRRRRPGARLRRRRPRRAEVSR